MKAVKISVAWTIEVSFFPKDNLNVSYAVWPGDPSSLSHAFSTAGLSSWGRHEEEVEHVLLPLRWLSERSLIASSHPTDELLVTRSHVAAR